MAASSAIATRINTRQRVDLSAPRKAKFDRRLADILTHAANVFCEKGYEGASMRDLARATGMSLAGLYYYFKSKERLLYLIQKHSFLSIIAGLKDRLDRVEAPEERVRVFVLNHLEYFLENKHAMKVLSHESGVLKNSLGAEVATIKREYYQICVGLLDDLKRERKLEFQTRLAVLSLFGMMNWIYTWHNPRVDSSAEVTARQMSNIFLRGVAAKSRRSRKGSK